MKRIGWSLLAGLVAVTAMADEPGVARLSSEPMPAETETGRKPFVNLDVRLIELHGKALLPINPMKLSRNGKPSSPEMKGHGILTTDQWIKVRETWKSEPEAKILTAARLRMKLGTKGEYRKGREIPVAEQTQSDNGSRKSLPIIRKEFCGTSIDATFTAVDVESIAVEMQLAHTTQEDRDPVSGSTLSTTLHLEDGKTLFVPVSKNEHTARASRLPFAREELKELGLIVLVTPRLEDGDSE